MATRLTFINSHPIQYKAPLYAYLNTAEDLDVSAIYLSDISLRGGVDPGFKKAVTWDVDLLSGYRAIFVDEAARHRTVGGFFSLIAPRMWEEIRSGRHDALVIHGHNYASHHIALAAARSVGLPVFMRCETHLGLARPGAKAALRKPLLTSFYRHFDGFLAIGTANADFYRAMGVPDHQIFLVPYTVDNARFAAMSALPPTQRQSLRARWGVHDDRPIILFAAKFQPRKHPDDLIRACAQMFKQGLRFHLLLVGSGEMAQALKSLAADNLPPDCVTFPGFMNQSELPHAYGASDIFVLPSRDEPWGLAINEAMAAGLPVVASREIGAVADIVIDGKTGFVFEAGDCDGLAAALSKIVGNSDRRAAMARAARQRIATWSYAECLDGVRGAVGSVREKIRAVNRPPLSNI